MRKVPFLSFILVLLLAAFWLTMPTGCANIIPPSGGPRDTLPPQLVSATPGDSTLNFSANRITLTFDEYVDLQEVQGNLLFTPTFNPDKNPEVSVRGRAVTVRFRDSLLRNTTYVLNFGNAIRDINESNPVRDFTYVFSTGSALDSLTVSGKVVLADNGKTDSTLIVLLHTNLADSAVRKERPVYMARVANDGSFRFRNLPGRSFAIYALGDAGIMRRYQDSTRQYFAFANAPVVAGTTKDLTLYAYRWTQATTAPTTSGPAVKGAGERRLRLAPASGTVDLLDDYILNFPVPIRRFDSTLISLSTDSSFTPVAFRTLLDTTATQLRIRSQWREGTPYNLILSQNFAADTAGRQLLKADTLRFTTRKISDYGRINVRIRNIDTARSPVLQFIQGGQVVFAASVRSGGFSSRLFLPGEYELRILYDTNGNGRWDPGIFGSEKRQPEIVQPISQGINVKADWDNEFERVL